MKERIKFDLICREMANSYPILAPTWEAALERFGDHWLRQFISKTETVFGEIKTNSLPEGFFHAMSGYAEFCNDSLRNQVFFEKNGRYKSQSYSECLENFYLNEEHMLKCYLPGMWISHYIWPQHYNMLTGFVNGALRRVAQKTKVFFEVGVGCGMYSQITAEYLQDAEGVGFDISDYSLEFTKKMMELFGLATRYKTIKKNILEGNNLKCDFLICQEVLEHLENPEEFCGGLFDLVSPGGYAYITAALNAAHSDHIFLIRNPLELEKMLRTAGFIPLSGQEEFAPGGKPRNLTPSLAGYLCRKP